MLYSTMQNKSRLIIHIRILARVGCINAVSCNKVFKFTKVYDALLIHPTSCHKSVIICPSTFNRFNARVEIKYSVFANKSGEFNQEGC